MAKSMWAGMPSRVWRVYSPPLGSLAHWDSGSRFAMQGVGSTDSLPRTDIPSASAGAARAALPNQKRFDGTQNWARYGRVTLLRRDQIKFPRSLFIEQCAVRLIATAPMLVASGNTYEIAGSDALLTGVIFVQVSAFYDDNPDIVCVSVHSGVEAGLEFRE